MALFDSIIGSSIEKFGLSKESAGGLLAALVGLIADPKNGGFGGFLDKFRNAGLGSAVDSWITTGDNGPLSDTQVESALGAEAIGNFADQAGVDRSTATSALAGMIPGVVDTLTPDGEVPDEASLLTRIGGFLSDWGGAIGGAVAGGVGAVAAMAGGAADKVGDTAGAARDKVSGAIGGVSNAFDAGSGDSGSILKWLLPLLLLLLLIALGWMFCGRSATPTVPANANSNTNTNRTNVNVAAKTPTTNASATTAEPARTLGEVTLSNGTKLQAYPGGIEDQLVKFIQSDDYKKGTADQLKDKWFSFDDLNFKFGTTELAPESKRQLDNIVAILKANPDVKIKIGGYTDKKGDDAANLKLSDSRAKAVQGALQKAGVGTQVPEAEGYGEKFATVDENGSDEARKVDRKTAVRLIK
ncbi:MAG: YidB family protein [Pyrinomonadaceae bacterium]